MSARAAMLLPGFLAFSCPACRISHVLQIGGEKGYGWNGNFDAPTLSRPFDFHTCRGEMVDGEVTFDLDCAHALAGLRATIPLWADRV